MQTHLYLAFEKKKIVKNVYAMIFGSDVSSLENLNLTRIVFPWHVLCSRPIGFLTQRYR